ncbi:MAG: WD40 repeat domain-containing protein, partial [Anaerolineaceae bacterium]|nr:WD40 repeat domain-containing protein [Anaerolineaceae bacterium]
IFASLSNKNAAEANRQTLRARAGELSAQAKLMQEQFPQRAALLAMEAVNLDVRASQPPDPLALTVLWQTATQRRSTLLPGIQAELLDAAYHPQGRWIAAVDTIGNLYFWDGSDPSKDPVIMNRGDLFLFSISFSPDGKWLAGASTNKIVLWDMENLEEQPAEILPPEPGVTTIAFNPDSTLFSSGTINGNIYTWKTSDLQRYPQRLATECGRTYALNFNPGGDMLAVGCAGLKDQKNPVLLYSLKSTQTNPIVFSGHTNTISQIAFSKDGQWLVSGSSDRTARVWKLTNPEELPVILDGFKGDVFDVVISPDQKHLAVSSGDFSIHIWELNNLANPPEILHGHENWVSGISYSPDSKKLLSASWDKQIRIWDLEHTLGLPVEVRGTSMGVYAPTFSTDGKWLASGSLDGKLQLWDTTNTDSQPKSMQLHQGRFYTLMFHPNGRWLISTGQDKKLQIFDVETKQVVQSVQLDEEITAITLRRDGKQLAGVGSKNVIHLWQVDDLSIPAIDLPRPDSTTYALAYSPDGQKLVSSHEDFSIRIHTLQKLSAESKTLKGPRGATLAMTFNPTGTILATTGVDRMIRLWDITQDEPTSSILTGHERPLSALAFSPDGTLLASGGGDHTIRVWRVEAGSSASPIVLPMNGDFATLLTFSADGKRLASGAWNGSLTLWPMEVKQLQEYACQFTGRNLTDLEWQQFLPDEKMRSTCSQWVTTSP